MVEIRRCLLHIFSRACRGICVLGLLCVLSACHWQEAREVIAMADSIDQNHHVIYDDTAALGQTIRTLDNPFGRLLMSNTLGKAYYYMGRNLEDSYQQVVEAAECYIEADRLQIDDPIYRGRVNACMGYICSLNNNDSLSLIFYERASEDFQAGGSDWYYAQMLLTITQHRINLHQYLIADSLLQMAQTYPLDRAYQARYYETRGLYFYELHQYDSALVYFERGLDCWSCDEDRCFSYLKIMQVYFDLDVLEKAIPYAQYIIGSSNNPNYLANAYYCLMQDAKRKNNVELLSKYSHIRTDVQKLLRDSMLEDAEALPKIEEYVLNPHPMRWVWFVLSIMIASCIFLAIGVWIYRQRNYTARQQIYKLSTEIQDQEMRLSKELHYHNLKKQIAGAQSKYRTPLNRWLEYSVLKKDLNYWLHDWIDALDTLPLSEREKIFCTLSLAYSHLTDVDIAEHMCYSKYGIRMMKNRMLKKIGISATEFLDFLHNLSYMQ